MNDSYDLPIMQKEHAYYCCYASTIKSTSHATTSTVQLSPIVILLMILNHLMSCPSMVCLKHFLYNYHHVVIDDRTI